MFKKDLEIAFVDTHAQLVNIFTKPLAKEPFYKLKREFGILDEIDIILTLSYMSRVTICYIIMHDLTLYTSSYMFYYA